MFIEVHVIQPSARIVAIRPTLIATVEGFGEGSLITLVNKEQVACVEKLGVVLDQINSQVT